MTLGASCAVLVAWCLQGDEWEEKWGEHYHDSGKVAKYADKWGKAGEGRSHPTAYGPCLRLCDIYTLQCWQAPVGLFTQPGCMPSAEQCQACLVRTLYTEAGAIPPCAVLRCAVRSQRVARALG